MWAIKVGRSRLESSLHEAALVIQPAFGAITTSLMSIEHSSVGSGRNVYLLLLSADMGVVLSQKEFSFRGRLTALIGQLLKSHVFCPLGRAAARRANSSSLPCRTHLALSCLFRAASNFLAGGVRLQTFFFLNCTCICRIESIHLRCSGSNPLEGAFSEPARLSHPPNLLF